MNRLQVFSLAWPVTALGPGNRLVLWLAGCGRDCPGCISPEMQPRDAGRPVGVDTLAERILRISLPLAGFTVSGGEPFDQAPTLAALLDRLTGARPDWSVIVYTGYLLEALRERADAAGLLARVDILVDGPYHQDIPRNHPLAGSGNQRVHYLTERGTALRGEVEALPVGGMNYGLSGNGDMDMIIGVTSEAQRAPIQASLGRCEKCAGDERQ